MSTETLQVSCNTRPVRLAFLVDGPKPDLLEEVFRLNSLLWGGMLNPVAILDPTNRKQKGVHYVGKDTDYGKELLSLAREFDPDFLVNYSNAAVPSSLAPFRQRTLRRENLRWNPWGTGESLYFLESWPFVYDFWREELRFAKSVPVRFGYVEAQAHGEMSAYLSARFGGYPEGHPGNQWLKENCAGSAVTYDEAFRKAYRPEDWQFPIGSSVFKLDIPLASYRDSNQFFFLLDPCLT